MSTDDPTAKLRADREARRLADACIRACQGQNVQHVAILGYEQAMMALATCQALVNLFKHKNLLSESEIEGALAHAFATYSARMEQGSSSVIVRAPAPSTRSN